MLYKKLLQVFIIVMLIGAILIELIWDVHPCSLCSIQRALWLITLLLLTWNMSNLFIIGSLLINLLVSVFQTSMQYGIIATSCPIDQDNKIYQCNTIDFSILGISLAGYNAIIITLFIIYILFLMRKKHA